MGSRYRNNLPQLDDEFFLTDGGMETDFVFHRGVDLPQFASFHWWRRQRAANCSGNISHLILKSRAATAPGSLWKALPGAPTEIGALNLAMTRTPSSLSIATALS